MCSFLKVSIPPWQDAWFVDRAALFQLDSDDLVHLMFQCELALSCIKDEVQRRKTPSSPNSPSPQLWKTVQLYHRSLPTPLPPNQPDSKRRFLSLLGHDRLSQIPNDTFNRLTYSEKATVVQLSFGPWTSHKQLSSLHGRDMWPANPPASAYPSHFFGRLDTSDALQVLKVISFAGGDVPEYFLLGACESRSWGSDGELRLQKSKLTGAFESTQRCEQAILTLIECGAVKAETHTLFAQQTLQSYIPVQAMRKTLVVRPELQSYITRVRSWAKEYRIMALTAILYAFPKDSFMEPLLFTQRGLSMIPILSHLLPYLWELQQPTAELLELAFETLYSSSQFTDPVWKETALNAAEQIAHVLGNPLYLLRINFRGTALSRLLNRYTPLPYSLSSQPGIDARTNSWLGQFRIHQAQVLLDKSANTEEVIAEVNRFVPLDDSHPSHQEKIVLLEGKFLIAKSLRFEGKFREALHLFGQIREEAHKFGSRILWRLMPHIAETQSEIGLCHNAIVDLDVTIDGFSMFNSLRRGNGRRLMLALANCHLMEILWTWKEGRQIDAAAIDNTLSKFQTLKEQLGAAAGLLSQHNRFVVHCGLAMAYHINGDVEKAYLAWKDAATLAESIWKEPGFAQIITTYSQSEVAFRLCRDDAEDLRLKATQLWESVNSRQFYFIALGSLWPNVLHMLETRAGRQGIIPMLDEGSRFVESSD